MMQLLGVIGILCCGQDVFSLDIHFVPGNLNETREICDTNGLVLPRTSDDNMHVAQTLQQTNISATWIDLTISPSAWNWITGDEYAVHYDQGCYNSSSIDAELITADNITDINTCIGICAGYLYLGVQTTSTGFISCVCTNRMETSSAVSEFRCNSNCTVIGVKQFCGKNEKGTFRLLSRHKLSWWKKDEVINWDDNNGLNTSIPFLCASLLIKQLNSPPYINLVPQDCTAKLPAICEADDGKVTSLRHVSWFEARQLCHENGMKSVRVSSPSQTNILATNIAEGWTALRGWTWKAQGTQGLEICDTVPSNWSAGYPNRSEGECIVVQKDGSWKNVPCDTKNAFLCESSNTSSPAECRSSNSSTSANTSCLTTTMEASTTPRQLTTTTSEPHTVTTSDPHRNTYSDIQIPTRSLTEVTHTMSSIDHFTTETGHSSNTTSDTLLISISGLGVTVVAAVAVIASLVLAAVVVIVIVFLRKSKQASSGASSPQTQRHSGDDKSLRPECDQSMDELPIYARPNKDPPIDGVILVVENSLYGSVDPDDDELASSRCVAPTIANARGQGTVVYELAMVSIGDENNDDSTSGQEAGDLLGSNSSMKDQVLDDDPLMIDNSLYDSTDSAMDGLPVP